MEMKSAAPNARSSEPTLGEALTGLRTDAGKIQSSLDRLLSSLDANIQALNLEIPVPLESFKLGAAPGVTASPLAGTDPLAGGPTGGADKGGSGYGAQETPKGSGGKASK